tara:strand:- start:520 stop:807 length:288 start_codon:yes stop_codon:yes gene_type:complete
MKPFQVKPSSSEKIWIKCKNGHHRHNKICDICTKKGITKCKTCLEFTIKGKKYSSMTDFCNKHDISRTTFCRKMKSQEIDIKNIDKIVEFIEKNY